MRTGSGTSAGRRLSSGGGVGSGSTRTAGRAGGAAAVGGSTVTIFGTIRGVSGAGGGSRTATCWSGVSGGVSATSGSGSGAGSGAASGAGSGAGAGRARGGVAGAVSSRGASAVACAASKSASETKLTSVTRIVSRSRGPNHGSPKTASAMKAPWPMAEILVPVRIARAQPSEPSNFGPPCSVTSPMLRKPLAFSAPITCITPS